MPWPSIDRLQPGKAGRVGSVVIYVRLRGRACVLLRSLFPYVPRCPPPSPSGGLGGTCVGAWLPAVSSTVRLHLFRDVVNRFAVREAQMHDFEANITFYDLTNPVYSNVTLTGSFFILLDGCICLHGVLD